MMRAEQEDEQSSSEDSGDRPLSGPPSAPLPRVISRPIAAPEDGKNSRKTSEETRWVRAFAGRLERGLQDKGDAFRQRSGRWLKDFDRLMAKLPACQGLDEMLVVHRTFNAVDLKYRVHCTSMMSPRVTEDLVPSVTDFIQNHWKKEERAAANFERYASFCTNRLVTRLYEHARDYGTVLREQSFLGDKDMEQKLFLSAAEELCGLLVPRSDFMDYNGEPQEDDLEESNNEDHENARPSALQPEHLPSRPSGIEQRRRKRMRDEPEAEQTAQGADTMKTRRLTRRSSQAASS